MSQYGKPEYWDERYARYFGIYAGIMNLSIGTSATVA